MKTSPIVQAAQWTLILGLFLITLWDAGMYAAVASVLLILHVVFLFIAPTPPVGLSLSAATAVLLPLCADASGAGFAAVLGALPALVMMQAGLRRLTTSRKGIVPPMPRRGLRIYARGLVDLPSVRGRQGTAIAYNLALIGITVLALGVATGHHVVAATGVIVLAWVLGMVGFVVVRMPAWVVRASRVRLRTRAGTRVDIAISLSSGGRLPHAVYLRSAHPWAQVHPSAIYLEADPVSIRVSMVPPLAGPTRLTLDVLTVDPWALTVAVLRFDVADLRIIPRARYAAWLAQRYLKRAPAGEFGRAMSIRPGPLRFRGGNDYRGLHAYVPGDSLRMIDWKATAKLRRIVVKHFGDEAAPVAVLLVALEAENADAADRAIHHLVVAALTLAQEGIPAVLAGYAHNDINVTRQLGSRELVQYALKFADRFVRVTPAPRILGAPRIGKLRSVHCRLELLRAAGRLRDLIALELRAAHAESTSHPAARALREAVRHTVRPATVLTLPAQDYPAGVALLMERLTALGYRIVPLRDETSERLATAVKQAAQAEHSFH